MSPFLLSALFILSAFCNVHNIRVPKQHVCKYEILSPIFLPVYYETTHSDILYSLSEKIPSIKPDKDILPCAVQTSCYTLSRICHAREHLEYPDCLYDMIPHCRTHSTPFSFQGIAERDRKERGHSLQIIQYPSGKIRHLVCSSFHTYAVRVFRFSGEFIACQYNVSSGTFVLSKEPSP